MRLTQKQRYGNLDIESQGSNANCYFNVLQSIVNYLSIVRLVPYTRLRSETFEEKGYLVRVTSTKSRMIIISYLETYPLLSSKRLDFNNWRKAHLLVKSRSYRTLEGTQELKQLKESMNDSRSNFDWNHLKYV